MARYALMLSVADATYDDTKVVVAEIGKFTSIAEAISVGMSVHGESPDHVVNVYEQRVNRQTYGIDYMGYDHMRRPIVGVAVHAMNVDGDLTDHVTDLY